MTIGTVQQLEEAQNTPNGIRDEIVSALTDFRDEWQQIQRTEIEGAVSQAMLQQQVRAARLPMPGQRSADLSARANPKAPGAPLNGQWDSLGEFLGTVYRYREPNEAKARQLLNFSSDTGAAGGFLIPEDYRATLMQLMLQGALIRPRATVIPMPRGNLTLPVLRDTSHTSSVFGGIVAYWEDEGSDLSLRETSPTFGQVKLNAWKLIAYTIVPNELLNDSAIALEVFIREKFPQAIRHFEERALMRGSGAGQPLGFLNSGALITVAAAGGQAADTIVYQNIVNMYARMIPSSLNNAIWLYNPEVFPELATMALNVGTGGSAVWLTNVVDGPPTTIMGRPAYPSELCSAKGDVGDIVFIDPSFIVIGDTQELAVRGSEEAEFKTDRSVWRIIERMDARPWIDWDLDPAYGTNSVSPFVALAAR